MNSFWFYTEILYLCTICKADDVGKKERNNQVFFERMRFKYRVSILDENTLEESWYLRLSRLSIFLYACIFLLVTFVILATLVYITPLRYYLPGYGDEGNRATIIAEAMRVDSLQQQLDRQAAYIEVIRNVIAGNLDTTDIKPLDSVVVIDKKDESGIVASERERQFVQQFEEEEKYNLAILSNPPRNNIYMPFRPVKGIIQQHFNAVERVYGISILTSPGEAVSSILDGTVVYTDYSLDNGWVIQIQHEDNYLSICKNNARLLKKTGEVVRAGEHIAITGYDTEEERLFYFELWNNGDPIDPEDVILF